MVYSDPVLQPFGNSTLVSMAHLLVSTRYGPAHFMLMDIMGSMVYGIRQRVEYDTNLEPFHHEPHPVEWANCFPGGFQILLAMINNCRDQEVVVGYWQNIEQRLLSWSSRPKVELKGQESWKLIAWMAVQESWRRTLLIYLYLAVCGVPTDDPRIQPSLRQLFQLMGIIKRQDTPIANVIFLAQCFIAGICSQTEKRKWLVRERLGHAAENRFWMFRGLEIIPVLEHLWEGAASGGRAVTWDDYIHSRRTALLLSG
ncbi:fungal-specific transcription factor domain-containing protein [Rhizoctonia solani]|nr:fungal-specific transcription factor domain-containing protein [Rhizoctonia solani]